jgi:voltage-gated potassium channel
VPYIVGDATEDHTLQEAGIDRALGIVFTLGNDRDNLFATISARSLNPNMRIVTRGENPQSEQKFLRAGATSIIFTNVLGGMRMAAEVIRPEVTGFLDLMMHDHGEVRRIEELRIPKGSSIVGKTLREANLREHADALVVAIYDITCGEYTFNPGPNQKLTEDTKIIVLTLVKDVPKIEKLLRG